jgi:hypothetical protein
MSSIATQHSLMGLRRIAKYVGANFAGYDMPACVQGFLTSGTCKWIWSGTITFTISSAQYRHTCLDCLPQMEMYIQIARAFSSLFMKKIEY